MALLYSIKKQNLQIQNTYLVKVVITKKEKCDEIRGYPSSPYMQHSFLHTGAPPYAAGKFSFNNVQLPHLKEIDASTQRLFFFGFFYWIPLNNQAAFSFSFFYFRSSLPV